MIAIAVISAVVAASWMVAREVRRANAMRDRLERMRQQHRGLLQRFYRRNPVGPALGDVRQARAGKSGILCANRRPRERGP